MSLDDRVSDAWRRVAIMAVAGGLFVGLTFLVTTLFFLSRINTLEASVAAGDRQTECRSRIASAAEVVRTDRDSLGWQSLVDRIVAGQTGGDLGRRSEQMTELNRRLFDATDLRARSIEVCAANPDFQPN
jgi:hypothetical protein